MRSIVEQWDSDRWITEQDFSRSRTSFDLGDLKEAVKPLRTDGVHRLLDIGCGFGGLSALTGHYTGAEEICGVDIDERVIEEARSKGVSVQLVDAGTEALPYPDGHFDLVMTLGMMDYLITFDAMIREMNRVLSPGGRVLVALPNLGSWHNRLVLLRGYQPRDVEVSSEVLVGVPGNYPGVPAGHIHIPTVRAFTELMTHHGFRMERVTGGRPRMNSVHPAIRLADKLFTRRATLARRFYYLGVKERSVPEPENQVQATYQSLNPGR
jgi:SAM-dependent methyltransferase